MTKANAWLAATALALVLGWCGANMDGPSPDDEARDVASAVAVLGTEQQFIHPGDSR